MEGKATPTGLPRTFSLMLGRVEITGPRRTMEGKETPSGPAHTFSVMLGWVAELPGIARAFFRRYILKVVILCRVWTLELKGHTE